LSVVAILIATAVGFGTRVGATRSLPGLRHGTADEYTQNAIGKLRPVTAQFTEERLGRGALRRTTTNTTAPTQARPRTTTTLPPAQTITGAPGFLAPGGWELTLRFNAVATKVQAGDEIHYRMIVVNKGSEDFRGRSFTLQWHSPQGTVARNGLEQCNIIGLDVLRAICESQRLLVSPGLGDARHDSFNSAGLVAIGAGQQWVHDWYVQTLPSAQPGMEYHNHAHLTVNVNGKDVTITSPDLLVTVVAA
jgi:hypothetical protein